MALRTPPSWLQNGSHPAEQDRLTTQGLWRTSGILSAADLAVTQSTVPAMSVQIAAGWGNIIGTTQANMGAYQYYNDAAATATITTADVTNPRIDLICITINDAYYTGVTNNVAINVVAGTPAASPAVPTLPANSYALAQVAVAANATTIVNANITDLRVRAVGTGGQIIRASSGQTTNLQEWQNSAGTVLANMKQDGTLLVPAIGDIANSTPYITLGSNKLTVQSRFNTNVGLIVQGAASQTADLLQTQTSAGAVQFAVGANGTIATGTTAGAPTIASASTIAPVTPILFVSGVTTLQTITPPAPISTNGGQITIIPTGIFATNAVGNIALASTAIVNKALILTFDPITTKWYPSY